MATYLYCIRNDPRGAPGSLAGIDGSVVRSIFAIGLTAWVSDVSEVPVAATVERIRAHDAVCAAALALGDTPLPVRFGQSFSDDAAAVDAIASRRPALRERIGRISGCVELRIVVSRGRDRDVAGGDPGDAVAEPMDAPAGDETRPSSRGTAYLQRLAHAGRVDLAREVGCEELRHAIRTSARDLVVEHQPCESARGVSFFPLLVRREDVEACRSAVSHSLVSRRMEASVLGPFPPYSFAGDA
jgi:hypothetical protein